MKKKIAKKRAAALGSMRNIREKKQQPENKFTVLLKNVFEIKIKK